MITDKWLDKMTMYRLTLYYLLAIALWAAFLGVFNFIPFTPTDIGMSILVVVVVSGVANWVFAKLFHAITNIESVFITALILALIIPAHFPYNLFSLVISSTAQEKFQMAATKIINKKIRIDFTAEEGFGSQMLAAFLGGVGGGLAAGATGAGAGYYYAGVTSSAPVQFTLPEKIEIK